MVKNYPVQCLIHNFLQAWYFFIRLSSADFFLEFTFSTKSFRNTISVSNCLDPDQDRHSVGPDLGPNCLQRLSADDESCRKQGKSSHLITESVLMWMMPPYIYTLIKNLITVDVLQFRTLLARQKEVAV